MDEDVAAQTLKAGDPARYYASLGVADPVRAELQALYAFDLETLAVRERVSEPMPGEIRLQWWRDTVDGLYREARSGHPVADGLAGAIRSGRLPREAFMALLDARLFDLYDDALADMADLEGHFGATFSAVIQMACLILARGGETGSAQAAGHGGVAAGIAWLMRNLGRNAARGQAYVPLTLLARHGASPDDMLSGRATPELGAALAELCALGRAHLDDARKAAAALPGGLRPAFAHLAVTDKELHMLARGLERPFAIKRTLSPLGVFWRVQVAARRGL